MRNDFYVGVFEDNYLAHFGRLHQRWGVRNGPPYPLDRETVSKAYGSDSNKHRGKRVSSKVKTGGLLSGLISDHDQEWDEVYYDSSTGVTSFAGRKAQKSYEESISQMQKEIEEEPDLADWYSRKSESNLYEQVRSGQINPGFGSDGTVNNCTKAAVLCELTKRGLSGFSAGRQTEGSDINAEEYWFDGAKSKMMSYDDAVSFFNDLKPGSSGTFDVFGKGFGHTLHYMVTIGGYLRISDGQNGDVFDGNCDEKGKSALDRYFEKYKQFSNEYGINITDLDGCEPNWEHIAQDGVIRGNKVRNDRTRKVVDRW